MSVELKPDDIGVDIRVGEAFTNERKSSAACREGLAAMVRRAHDSTSEVEARTQGRVMGVGRSRVARSG